MEPDVTYSAFQSLMPHFNALARVGYYKLIIKLSRPKLFMHNIYQNIMLMLVITYNIQHVIRVVQVRHSTDQIVDILFILLTTLNTLCKQIAFNLRTKRLDEICSVINGDLFAPNKIYHTELLKKNAVNMYRLLAFYHSAIFACAFMWALFPIVNKALGEEVQFTAYFPFQTTDLSTFTIALIYMSTLITIQAYGNVTMDCTIVAFYSQAKTQIQMLRYDFEHLLSSDNDADETKTNNKSCNHSYVDASDRAIELRNRFTKEIESIFSEAMIVQFFVMAWVICMTVYKIIGLSILSAEFVSMVMYLLCMLAQLFIYCYFGSQLKVESEYINQSIYCSGWLNLSPRYRRLVLGIMQNCSRALTPRTAYVIPMSLDTYIAVLKSSYTLFTLINRKE